MSIPLLVGLLVLVVVIGTVAGLWRARGKGAATVQSSVMTLLVVLVAAALVWFVLGGR